MWNMQTCLLVQLTTILWNLRNNYASAQASAYLCKSPCVESFDESCEELMHLYDWSGDCCSLADNNGTGGCNLTTVGSCTNNGRTYPIFLEMSGDPSEPYYLSALGGLSISRTVVEKEGASMECPVSAYQPFRNKVSKNQAGPVLQMTLSGLSSALTYDEAMQWSRITEQHLLDTYEEENLDLMTYIEIPQEDIFPIEPDVDNNGDITITYVQMISWREPTITSKLDAMTFITGAFGDISALSNYLSKLQAEEAFVSITALSWTTYNETTTRGSVESAAEAMSTSIEITTEETAESAAEAISVSIETKTEETSNSSTIHILSASSMMATLLVWFHTICSKTAL